MIKFIAAVDSKLGIADEHGIPWQGRLPTDIQYYHEELRTGTILMGRGVYVEISKPYGNNTNYVATNSDEPLHEGFAAVKDPYKFLKAHRAEDIWNIGGAMLFASTIDLADELYLTRINQDFNCTKFFPGFESKFNLVSSTPPQSENGITFHFEVWQRK